MFDRLTGAVADASQSRDGLKVPPSPQSVHQPPLLSSMWQVAGRLSQPARVDHDPHRLIKPMNQIVVDMKGRTFTF